MRRKRLIVVLAVAGLVASACTGAPRPENVAAGDPSTDSGISDTGTDPTTELTTDTTAAPTLDAAGNPVAPGSPAATNRRRGAGQAATNQTTSGASTTPGVRGTDGITPANLFSADQDRVGITDTTITICGHAALIFASAFNTRPEDINLYWQAVKDRGGIHGRNIQATYEDDRYDPAAAVDAAERCKAKNPFFILGGIGFDQIPAVRAWADQNKQLYFHHIAVGAGGEDKRFSFTSLPTVEQVGTASGEHITSKYRDKKVGIIYRNSENWDPGFKAGRDYMKRNGVNVTRELPVERNASVYSQQILALRGNADVVWIWENALAAAEIIKQANSQDYYPTWVVFPFQTTLDVVGTDALRSRIDGVSTWPAYKPGGYGAPHNFPGTGYTEEIAAFEAAMRKYRPGVAPNDILWQVWIANKGIEDMLLRCGRDCTRNRLAGVLLSGYKGTVAPNCPADFTRGNPRRGGWFFMTQEAFREGDAAFYRNTSWCREHLR